MRHASIRVFASRKVENHWSFKHSFRNRPLGSLAGVDYWQRSDGRPVERLVWQEKQNEELADANQVIDELHKKAREQEANHAKALNDISRQYQEELKNADTKTQSLIARVRAGDLRLRDAYAADVKAGLDQTVKNGISS